MGLVQEKEGKWDHSTTLFIPAQISFQLLTSHMRYTITDIMVVVWKVISVGVNVIPTQGGLYLNTCISNSSVW